mgnify:CR=1 FL=1
MSLGEFKFHVNGTEPATSDAAHSAIPATRTHTRRARQVIASPQSGHYLHHYPRAPGSARKPIALVVCYFRHTQPGAAPASSTTWIGECGRERAIRYGSDKPQRLEM